MIVLIVLVPLAILVIAMLCSASDPIMKKKWDFTTKE